MLESLEGGFAGGFLDTGVFQRASAVTFLDTGVSRHASVVIFLDAEVSQRTSGGKQGDS